MWRSIAARTSFTKNSGRKLLPLQNAQPQVLIKPLKSSSCVSHFLSSRVYPIEFRNQNHRIFSYSSITEVGTNLQIENGGAFDVTHVNSDAQMGSIGSDEKKIGSVRNVNVPLVNNPKLLNWFHLTHLLIEDLVDDNSLESTLDSLDLCLDEEIMVIVIHHLHFPHHTHTGRFFKWVLSKKEFRATPSILEELGNVVVQFSGMIDVYASWEFVKEVAEKEKGFLNAKILHNFLGEFSDLDNGKCVFDVYGKFEEFGCIPSGGTYYRTIRTLCRQFAYDLAIPVCQKMLDTGMLPEKSEQVVEIIGLLCKGDRAKEALAVYLAAKNFDIYPRLSLVNSLSKVVCCLAKVDETVHLAQEMLLGDISAEYRKYVQDAFLCVIRGLCRKNDIKSAKKLLFEMIEKGPPPGSEVFDSVIVRLSKARGELEDAWEILKLAESRGLTPKISSYSAIMRGYAKVGSMEEACEVLLAAKSKHTKLCPVGLCALIQGYCTHGALDKALRLFFELKNYGIVLNLDVYDELIKLFSHCLKDLDMETAQKLLKEMREKALYLPHITEGLKRAVKELQPRMVIGMRGMRPDQLGELNPVVI